MTKGIFIGDIHLKERVLRRKDFYLDTISKKLSFIFDEAVYNSVDYVCFLGDIFDVPEASGLVRNTIISVLRKYQDIPVFVVVGNHDIFGGNLGSLERTTLGTLTKVGLVNIVDENDDFDIQFVHYQKIGDINASNRKIVAVHAYLLPEMNVPFDYIDIKTMKTQPRNKLFISGHYHTGYDIVRRDDGVIFACPGSLGRIIVNDAERDNVFFAMVEYDDNNITIEYMPVPASPAEEIFDLSVYKIEKQEQERIESFLNRLNVAKRYTSNNIYTDILAFIDKCASSYKIDQDVIEEAKRRIMAARSAMKEDY